jgi:D-beta-D-heptose 7-phosphate kinase/D-beta-D-heptose 1-phosphate adenosyltransferase
MKKILINGRFDIIHRGHIEIINYAKTLADFLMICIESDQLIEKTQGPGRPIVSENDRKFVVENLKAVDLVCIYNDNNELTDIMEHFQPDIAIKSREYIKLKSGKTLQLIYYDRVEGYSTTDIINKCNPNSWSNY